MMRRCCCSGLLASLLLLSSHHQTTDAFVPRERGMPSPGAKNMRLSLPSQQQQPSVSSSTSSFRERSSSLLFMSSRTSRTESTTRDPSTSSFNSPDGDITSKEQSSPRSSSVQLQMSSVADDTTDLYAEKTKLINNIALINASVVGVLVFAALYQLFHVDVEALVALWEYDLGPHGGDLTKVAVAIDLFARLPVDAIRSYEALVPTNPIFYKACTSGVAYALGDFISQVYQGRTLDTIDLPRSFRSGAAGFIGHGPLCHQWLNFMETYLDFGGAWWATGIKVTADLTVWSIFLNAAYSFIIGSLAFRNPKDVWADVKSTSWPALRSAWRFWPFVHTISFSHAVPLDLKLLWVDAMEVVWVTILSKVANEDKNAKRDADEALETLDVVEPFGVDPVLEIELTREQEMDNTDVPLAFELPQKVLAACWPLIVMWPVLYAGYRIELLLGLEV